MNKRILIFLQRNWAINIGCELAEELKRDGHILAALTIKKATHDYVITHQKDLYEKIIFADEIKNDPGKFLFNDDYSLDEICIELGIESIWPFVQSLRNHVKSYKDKYYYGFKQSKSDEEIVLYIKSIYKNIKIIFNEFNPELIITPNFVSLQHIMFNLYGIKHNIPMIGITDTKIRDYYMFTHSYLDNRGPLFDTINLTKKVIDLKYIEEAKEYIKKFRNNFIFPSYSIKNNNNNTYFNLIKDELIVYYKVVKFFIRKNINRLDKMGITIDQLTPKYIFRDHYQHKRNKKDAENFNYYDFNKLKNYIYFPLQFQPEETIDVFSPRFNNQIETARQVAMSLPGDYTLVVKDHPAMLGLRPKTYLEKISRTPNVKLIDYRITSEKVLKKSSMVVTPNGTTLIEAAFLNIPGIQLGGLGTSLLLPNVFKHSDLSTLSSKIIEVLSQNFNTPAYEEGLIKFVTAVMESGFKDDYGKLWEKGDKDELNKLIKMYKKEINRIFNSDLLETTC